MDRNDRELRALIGALQAGEITREQHQKLEQLLVDSEAARRLYYDCVDVDMLLKRRLASYDPLPSGKTDAKSARPRTFAAMSTIVTHLATIAATIAIVLVLQNWVRNVPGEREGVEESGAPIYIATLAKSADCVWQDSGRPRFDGQRLLTDELNLERGMAEFRFDSGVRIVMDGPATMKIDSANSALLTRGQVVLHGSEAGSPFSLVTPTTKLLDIGTEYGASVAANGDTEVHVFEGEVSVEQRNTASNATDLLQLTEGQAGRFGTTGGSLITLEEDRFVRAIPDELLPKLSTEDALLAHESFDYPLGELGRSSGGKGWSGPWRSLLHRDVGSRARVLSDDTVGNGRCIEARGRQNVSWRSLATPVRLDVDAVYYISFLMKKRTAAKRGIRQYGSLTLRSTRYPDDDAKLSFGMSSESNLSVTHDSQQLLSAPPLPFDEWVLIVAKVAAGRSAPDQVMVRWYGPKEDVDAVEPHSWASVTSAADSDSVLSELSLRSGGDVSFLFDELCVTSTWEKAIEGVALAANRGIDMR